MNEAVQIPAPGVSVALLTPVATTGSPDFDALDRMVERTVAAGVVGLSPVGSTGEGARLSRRQRLQVIARVAAASQGLPVIAGVPCHAADDTLAEVAEAAEAGADVALIPPPGFYPMADAETLRLFEAIADRSPLPLVLYHIPSLARTGFSPTVVAQLARHPRVVGLKDSSRDLEYLRTVVRAAPGFTVVTGTDALLTESLAAGACGAIVASPNVAPGLAVALHAACTAGDQMTARRLQDQLLDLVSAARAAGFPAGWKAAAALTGVCGSAMVPPANPLPAERHDALRRTLGELGLLDQEGEPR